MKGYAPATAAARQCGGGVRLALGYCGEREARARRQAVSRARAPAPRRISGASCGRRRWQARMDTLYVV